MQQDHQGSVYISSATDCLIVMSDTSHAKPNLVHHELRSVDITITVTAGGVFALLFLGPALARTAAQLVYR